MYSRRSRRCRKRIATIAEKIHAIIKANAPEFTPRLWYGMPAYAKDGRVLCLFRPALKFKQEIPDVRLQ